MEDSFILIKENIKICTLRNLAISCLYLLIVPLFRGTQNLNEIYTAQCLEQSVSIIGIIMIAPLCAAEKKTSIRSVIGVKKIPFSKIIMLRFILNLCSTLLLLAVFMFWLMIRGCSFPFLLFIFGTTSTMIFLGCLGFMMAETCDNLIAGYLVSIGYYFLNWSGVIGKRNPISLFTLESGYVNQKIILLLLGLVIFGIGVKISDCRTKGDLQLLNGCSRNSKSN